MCSKENTMLRASLKSSKYRLFHNAVDSFSFTPDTTLRPLPSDQSKTKSMQRRILILIFFLVVIIVASRLVYRKGIDLLIGILPKIL